MSMPDPAPPTGDAGLDRACLLTPAGSAAIAIVRLIGPGVAAFLRAHFSATPRQAGCVHGELRDGAVVLDDPVITLLPGGASADLNLHGSPWIIQSVLDLAGRLGFKVIEPLDPPFPLEVVPGNTILEREVSAHLPAAATELAVRTLLHQPAAWDALLNWIPARPGQGRIGFDIEGILREEALHWLLRPPRVAIIGAPNAGKSTLANGLFARERLITADRPGTTRDWVGEIANLDGLAVMLVDTPGIRATDDHIEAQAIAASAEQVRAADLVVVVVDGARPLEGEQAAIVQAWPQALRIINKTDLPPAFDPHPLGGIPTVGTLPESLDRFRQAVRSRFGIRPDFDPAAPRCWTNRQRDILRQAMIHPELLRRILDG